MWLHINPTDMDKDFESPDEALAWTVVALIDKLNEKDVLSDEEADDLFEPLIESVDYDPPGE